MIDLKSCVFPLVFHNEHEQERHNEECMTIMLMSFDNNLPRIPCFRRNDFLREKKMEMESSSGILLSLVV